jgi:hypothetical protein
MAKLLDSKGQVLNPDPPVGFYLIGYCPLCADPLFYHGAGRFEETNAYSGKTHSTAVPEEFFQLCDCDIPAGLQYKIPNVYHVGQERESIILLMSLWHNLRGRYITAIEQLEEMVNEYVTVSEIPEATPDDHGSTDTPEHDSTVT